MDLFAPHGAIKSTLWPASRKNNLSSNFFYLQNLIYIYDELSETPQDDSNGISAEKIKDVRALLKYYIFTKVPVKKSK